MNNIVNRITTSCLIAGFVFFGGCTPKNASEFQVGSLLALTGPNKSFGINQQRGFEIALEEINQAGGINGRPLSIVYADTQLDNDKADQEYKRISLNNNVKVIVGVTGSGIALDLAPLAERDKIVLLSSLDTSPKLTFNGGEYFYRNIASDAYSGIVLTEVLKQDKKLKPVLIFNSENAWATGCRGAMEDALNRQENISLAIKPIEVNDATSNFSSAIISFNDIPDVDSAFVCLMGRQAGLFAKQAVDAGLQITFYGTDSFSQQEFLDNAKLAAERAKFVLPAESKSEKYKLFEATYQKNYGEQADSISAKAYDALHTLAYVANKNGLDGTDGEKIKEALDSAEYNGITGINSFDENGDLRDANFEIFTYDKGQLKKIQ